MARKQAASPLKATSAAAQTLIALTQRESGNLPLNILKLSPRNARKRPPSQAGILNLAGQIKAQGLMHALHVTEELDENNQPTGFYLVEAGGRRWRALVWLAENGYIAADELIECKLIDGNALGLSVAENVTQEPMHAADEFTAIKAMHDGGDSVEAIAAFFAQTVVYIQRRLKLAAVAPVLFDQFSEGGITLDQMMALASVDDHERQIAAWESLSDYARHPQTIKARLAQAEVISTDSRVRFVGIEAYEAAGGLCRQDLFADGDIRYLLDPTLLDSLVAAKLAKAAEEVAAEGWLWVDSMLAYGHSEQSQFRPSPKVYFPETPEQITEREALEAQAEALQNKLYEWYDLEEGQEGEAFAGFDPEVQEEKIEAIGAQVAALKEARLDSSAIDKSKTGAVVTIKNGVLTIERGLIRKADAAKLAKQLAEEGNTAAAAAVGGMAKVRAEVSESLMFNLTAQRTAAIQAAMLGNQTVALAAMAQRIAVSIFSPIDVSRNPVRVNVVQCGGMLEKSSPTMTDSKAHAVISETRGALEAMLPEDSAEWLQWFIEHPAETLQMIAFGASQSVDTLAGNPSHGNAGAPLMQALGMDMADWWKADAGNYMALVPKAKMIEAVTEACGADAVGDLEKMKKAEAINFAADRVAATRWLPSVLRA